MNYLMVLPVPFYRLSDAQVALESAFAEHLRMMRRVLQPEFDRLTVAAPSMPARDYERTRASLRVIDTSEEHIDFIELHAADCGAARFVLRDSVPVLAKLLDAVRNADVVHAGISHNLKAIEFPSLLFAAALGKKSICVMDIDSRRSAWMNLQTGRWSYKSYFLCRYVYDPVRSLELRIAARTASLLMLKGKKLVEDYGRGRPHVKNILDTAHSLEHVIDDAGLEAKIAALRDPQAPLQVVYFGRLTAYKGVDRCLRAIAIARGAGSRPIRFHIVGAGEEEANLRRLATELGLDDVTVFHGAVPYGPQLFGLLRGYHLLLAAPMSEDTPRSAFDAGASGIGILAFDTYYYAELAKNGVAEVVPWPKTEAMGKRLAELNADREQLVPMLRKAVSFARENTQEIWLDRRMAWTKALLAGAGVRQPR